MNKLYQSKTRKHLFTETSPTISEIVYLTNRLSVNLYAECLLKTIAVKQKSTGGLNEGTSAISQFWSAKGVNTMGMYLNDGS